jgi:hypothetical protein
MTSIFGRALGADFDRLHPEVRRRFGVSADSATACVGVGVMDEVWHGKEIVVPFLRFGARRNVLFPEKGTDIPFTMEYYAYRDCFGCEVIRFVRTFDVSRGRRRRFEGTIVYSERRAGVVDYLGTHQQLAVDLHASVDDRGAMVIRSGEQRFRAGPFDCRLPAGLTGRGHVREWYDEETERLGIQVTVTNPLIGPVFGYRGSYTARLVDTTETPVPASVKPYRERPHD